MNLLTFCGKMLLCLGMSLVISLLVGIFFLSVMLVFVNLLQLNYHGNSYWVLNLSVFVWFFSWFLTYSYLLTIQ